MPKKKQGKTGPLQISPAPPPRDHLGLSPWQQALERIQLDSSRAGTDGQDAQRRAIAKGTGLVWEAMLHGLQREACGLGLEMPLKSLGSRKAGAGLWSHSSIRNGAQHLLSLDSILRS